MKTSNQNKDIDYSDKWLNIARETVLKNIDVKKYAVFLFGSMVKDPLKAYDMDIGILGVEKVPFEITENIKDALDESIVPYRYDIVDFKDSKESFRKSAFKDIKIWNKPDYIKLK